MKYALLLILFLSQSVFASNGLVDDSDFVPPHMQTTGYVDQSLAPDRYEVTPIKQGLVIDLLVERAGTIEPVAGMIFEIKHQFKDVIKLETDVNGRAVLVNCPINSMFDVRVEADLSHSHFKIRGKGNSPYSIDLKNVECGQHITWVARSESHSGQALTIWRVAVAAYNKLKHSIGLGFWERPIEFEWPSGGDYYFFDTVHLTRGDFWDVVGHEMGHAIYDQARLGRMGGGAHKIDECYSTTLALSEGWASFFSAWVMIDLNDHDAKFPYMVQRRAPIRIENVPSDVCAKETNEWRVTSFFWDLIDLNNDAEAIELAFPVAWEAMRDQGFGSLSQIVQELERRGTSREWLNIVWALNFP